MRNKTLASAGAILAAVGLLLSRRSRSYRRILLVGDSQLDGGSTLGGRLAALLRARGFDVDVLAKYGHGAGYRRDWFLAERLPEKLKSFNPDLVLVSLGGNDANTYHPASKKAAYQQLIREWARLIKKSGAELRWFTPSTADSPAYQAKREKIAAYQREALEPLGVQVYDHGNYTDRLPRRATYSSGAPDGVHFRPTEYRMWAQLLNQGPLASLRPA